MQRRAITLIGALLVVALVLGACSNNKDNKTSAPKQSNLTGTLNASGATFPLPFYEDAIQAFREVNPGVTINYGGGGSGKGRQDLADQVVDWAGSDGLVKPEDVAKYKGGAFLYFPTVAAPITVSYNLTGVDGLQVSADLLAKIFSRQVKTWNDPAVKAENSGLTLPSRPIVVAHRADGSGTTENFTKFLTAAAPTTWKLASGPTVAWPADTHAGNGNAGVAQIVKSTAGAIGYVDLSDAKASALQTAKVKNQDGTYVAPTLDGASAALAGAAVNPDLTYNPLNAPGTKAYPITAPTWILVYKLQTDAAKAKVLKAFLTFVLDDGQKRANAVDYARLPDSIRTKAVAQITQIGRA